MLKYKNFLKESKSSLINEQNSTYNKDDVLIFNSQRKDILQNYKGYKVRIISVNGDGTYLASVISQPGVQIYAFENELSYENKKDNIESEPSDTYSPGDRVMVDGLNVNTLIEKRKGTIKKFGKVISLVDLDEDESRNLSSLLINIENSIIFPLNEPKKHIYKTDDIVRCIDSSSSFYLKTAKISKVWRDGDMSVYMGEKESGTITLFRPDQVELYKAAEKSNNVVSFVTDTKKTEPKQQSDVNPQKSNDVVGPPAPSSSSIEEDDDVEGENEVTLNMSAPLKKADLLEFSYKDFLLEDKVVTREEIMENRRRYKRLLKDDNIPEFKKIFYDRSLKTIDIIIQYYDFLTNKIAGDLPVYRTLEQVENKDLLSTKTKVKASESKEITDKYSFDQGIIAYWIFIDAVVFKTI